MWVRCGLPALGDSARRHGLIVTSALVPLHGCAPVRLLYPWNFTGPAVLKLVARGRKLGGERDIEGLGALGRDPPVVVNVLHGEHSHNTKTKRCNEYQ